MDRKKFIQSSLLLAGMSGIAAACGNKKKIKGSIIGASSSVGHLLRDKKFANPTEKFKKKIVIVGGGVSGLSAARHLHQNGEHDFMLLDLEKHAGGNAAHGENKISAFPWGAHYVPIPNNGLTAYHDFLQACGVIVSRDTNDLPVYNEDYLCFDPEERLYINGRWQDGLVPHFGLPADDMQQVERFLRLMNEYRYTKGTDGKDAFAIPVNTSSTEEKFTQLDSITMKAWLQQNAFSSTYLHEYINYCTRDDFGTPYNICSAWAGIHYFAARKGKGTNATHSDVITWPEGNGFLIHALATEIEKNILTECLAVSVQQINNGVQVNYFDINKKTLYAIDAEQCILSVPQFIAARLLQDDDRNEKVSQHLHYVPWMVANLTVNELEERSGAPLSWDNVIHQSNSLGYVEATHQLTKQFIPKKNLTYYLPLTDKNTIEARKQAQSKTFDEWTEQIIEDLKKVHPNIREAIEEINIMIWGHAMAQPLPGIIHGGIRKELSASINNRIHFAHTDLAGISIFEEAFYQGLNAAQKILQPLKQ